MTLPTSPALFSERTCCAILGRGPASEKSQAEEAQQDGEKGKMGGRSRAGSSQQMGGQRHPLSRLSERSGWPTGRLASWLVNVQMNAAVLPHSSPEPCLASSSCWPSSARHRGFLPVTGTQGALEKGRLVGWRAPGRKLANSEKHLGRGQQIHTHSKILVHDAFYSLFTPVGVLNPIEALLMEPNYNTLCSSLRLNTHLVHE